MTRYLFHNVYGEADGLIQSKPSDVVAVPFGWTPDIEQARNALLQSLGTSVSCLPALLYQVQETDSETGETRTVWRELRIGDWPRERWTWGNIEEFLSQP